MKRSRQSDLPSPARLLEVLLPELRPTIYKFLDAGSLAALASTCRVFYKDTVKQQTGPLFIPSAWRRQLFMLNMDCRRAFLIVRADLQAAAFFAGLGGAASRIELGFGSRVYKGSHVAFDVTISCAWTEMRWSVAIRDRHCECTDLPGLDMTTRDEMRETARHVYTNSKQMAYARRAVPRELFGAVKVAKHEETALNETLRLMFPRIRYMKSYKRRSLEELDVLIQAGQMAAVLRDLRLATQRRESELAAVIAEEKRKIEERSKKK